MKRFGKICLSLAAIFGTVITLASCAKKVWTVEFLDGSTSLSTQQVNNKETVNKPTDPTKTDYIFDDWYAEETFSTKFNFDTKIVSDTKIYAKFNQTVFTIKFNTNGGSEIEDKKVNLLETLVLPDNPTKEGGKFEGWFTDESLSQAFDAETKINSNLTLYAKWSDIVTLTFNSNGGSAITVQTIKKGSKAVAVEAPEKKGYTFVDWYKDEAFENVFNFETEVLNENTVIYAKWNRLPDPFGTNTGFGTLEGKELLSWEDLLTWAPVDSGVKFTEDLTSGNYTFGKGARIDTNILNTQGKNITVVLDGVDGANALHVKLTGASSTKTGTVRLYKDDLEGTPIDQTERILENKAVLTLDWEDLANGTYIINIKDDTVTDGDASVSAKVEYIYNDVIEKVTVTFDSDEGNAVDPQTIVKGTKATAPTSPEKASYRFDGWFLGEATTAFDFNTEVTEDITLKAHWTLLSNPVTVKVYNLNLMDPTQSELLVTIAGEKNEEMTITPKTITGFKFISLFDSNNKYVPLTFTPTADTNLYALYDKVSFDLATETSAFYLIEKNEGLITLTNGEFKFGSSISPLNKEDEDIKEIDITNAYQFDAHFVGKLVLTYDIEIKNDLAPEKQQEVFLYVFIVDEDGNVTHVTSTALSNNKKKVTGDKIEIEVNGRDTILFGRKGDTGLFVTNFKLECEQKTAIPVEISLTSGGKTTTNYLFVYENETLAHALKTRFFAKGKTYVVKASADATEVFDTNVKVTEFKKLYITEAEIEYTAKFVYIDNTNIEELGTAKYSLAQNLELINAPAKAGLIFNGWYLDKSCSYPVKGFTVDDFIVSANENHELTLYAKYDEASTLTLKVDGEEYHKFTVAKGTKLTEDDLALVELELEKTGYNFLGWFVTVDNVDEKITIDTDCQVSEDTVANAKFEKKTFNVTFDANGGRFTDSEPKTTAQIKYEEKVASTSVPAVAKSAYLLEGWYNGTTKWDFDNDVVTEGITLKANWERDPSVTGYVVTVNNNINVVKEEIVASGDHITNEVLAIENYKVIGVYTDSTKVTTFDIAAVAITDDCEIYVEYESTLYLVTIAINDETLGTVSKATVENVPLDTVITVAGNKLTINGTDVTATATAINDTNYQNKFIKWTGLPEDNKVVGPVTITANFVKQIKPKTFVFEGFTTDIAANQVGTFGTTGLGYSTGGKAYKHASSSQSLYTFNTNGEVVKEAVSYHVLKTDATIASNKWVSLDLTFLNEQDNIIIQFYVESANTTNERFVAITTTSTTTDNVTTISDWSKINIGVTTLASVEYAATGGKVYYFGSYSSGLNFYAINIFSAEEVKVNVDSMNGSQATEITKNLYSQYNLPIPTYAGYDFDGWYTVNTNGTLSKPLFGEAYCEKGTTLYAKWKLHTYSITYVMNDGTNAQANPATYNITSDEITLADPTRTGYTFDGWTYTGQTTPVKGVKIASGSTGNKEFTANWTPITYTIAFDANGGSGTKASIENCEYDKNISLGAHGLTAPVSTPNFLGWALSSDGAVVYADEAVVKSLTSEAGATVTLYAKWTAAAPTTVTVSLYFYDMKKDQIGTTPIQIQIDSGTTLTNTNATLIAAIPSGYSSVEGLYQESTLTNAYNSPITNATSLYVKVYKTLVANSYNFDALSASDSVETGSKIGGTDSPVSFSCNSSNKVKIQASAKKYTDANGNEVTSVNRLSTNGQSKSSRNIEIDLTMYSGQATIEVVVLNGSSKEADANRTISLKSGTWDGTSLLTSSGLDANNFSNNEFSITVNCGNKYYITSDVGSVNIYAILIKPVSA